MVKVHSYGNKSDLDSKVSYSINEPIDVRLLTSEARDNEVAGRE